MNIQIATLHDSNHIQKVHLSAFPEEENTTVAKLATDLLTEETTPQIVSLVAEVESQIVGHVAFSPVTINGIAGQGYILAPLAVLPEYQNQAIGSALINDGILRISEMGVHVLFVYGDPKYYSRFGFDVDIASHYDPPYELQYPFGWQAIILKEAEIATPAKLTCVRSLSDPALW